ncbi:MAG: glutathione S-transferase N-terminal domain-containing protein [Oleiphilaceae bacterium]|nr:glutathione S-transferase N-terminal domain-containing protein [Oleiphilaceae bacterium]
MKLYTSNTSPYARKVWICASLHGLDGEITRMTLNPVRDSALLEPANPLGRVPALVTDEGRLIVDSPVICQSLDELAVRRGRSSLMGPDPDRHEDERVLQALADGIMDAAFLLVMESARPSEQQSPFWKERWTGAIRRTLQHLNLNGFPENGDQPLTLGRIALGCALGYLDFRLDALQWREGCDFLAAWYQQISGEPVFRETVPGE